MTSAISTLGLKDKCKRFIQNDPTGQSLDWVIEDAIITASREISGLAGELPMAWNREVYDEVFTRYHAEISAITTANPGVITAESVDPDLSSAHGFSTGDIVFIDGIGSDNNIHRLNRRLFRVVKITDATMSLKALDGDRAIDTTDYEAYDSGGIIYHAGIVLPHTTIEPSDSWTILRVWDVLFDGKPAEPITEKRATAEQMHLYSSMPFKWRYAKYSLGDLVHSSIEHLLFWYGPVSQRYQVTVKLEKSYPDISEFESTVYPPHPPEIHDFIWHRALSNLATQSEKARRRSSVKDGVGDNTKIEILNAQYWIAKAADDEMKILQFHRSLLGDIPRLGGMEA